MVWSMKGRLACGALGMGLILAGPSAVAAERRPVSPDALQPCPRMGTGFVRTPGSPTCFRLSGRVTSGIDTRTADGTGAYAPSGAARLAIDTRTDSAYGPVRTFVRMGVGHP